MPSRKKPTKKKTKRAKKPKLTSLPVIRRRLFRMASLICRERADFTCEICGLKKGELYNDKPQRVEAHHIMSRSNKDSLLKFKQQNLICLCTLHHKTGRMSAHKHSIWFAEWLKTHKPEQYKWVLDHTDDEGDLNNRDVLESIEKELKDITSNADINWD